MRFRISLPLLLAFTFPLAVNAQQLSDPRLPQAQFFPIRDTLLFRSSDPPRSPELALRTFHETERQQQDLAGFTATSLIRATVPATARHAELGVLMEYIAPRTLQFQQTRFAGDAFVKRNVIARMLQSEVDHVARDEKRRLAINSDNYTFRYKGIDRLDARNVHVYGVKPRRKIAGLFKGEIYLDSVTAGLLRAKGTMVKSPSFFIRRIEFVQDYSNLDGFVLPAVLHCIIETRGLGKVVLDVTTQEYSVLTHEDTFRSAKTSE